MTELISIPYVGKAMVRDFNLLGVHEVEDLVGKSHVKLYDQLCMKTNTKQDPCVLDTFEMAVHYAETGESLPWWHFSRIRKDKEKSNR